MKRGLNKFFAIAYVATVIFACLSLSVPPNDLILFGILLFTAVLGAILNWKNRKLRLAWSLAIVISLVGGIAEISAGRRLRQHRATKEDLVSTNRRD